MFAKYSTLTIVVYGASKNYNAKKQMKNLSTVQLIGSKYEDGILYSFVPNFSSGSKL